MREEQLLAERPSTPAESRLPSVASNWNCARASCSTIARARTAAWSNADPERRGSASRNAFSRTPASVVAQRAGDDLIVEQAEAVERPERMQAAEAATRPCARPSRASARSAAVADRAATAAPCAATRGCRATTRRPAPHRSRAPRRGAAAVTRRPVWHDPVDAAAIPPKGELLGVLVELAGRPLRVLDTGAVVVDDVQRAVGTDVEVHRPEPGVGGRQELARRPAPTRDEGRARRLDHVTVHEVVHRLGDKRAARVLALEQPAGVDRQTAGRGELARLGQQLVLRVGRDRERPARRRRDRRSVCDAADTGELRVPLQVPRSDDFVTDVVVVLGCEVVAPRVKGVAVLRVARARLHPRRVEPEPHGSALRVHARDARASRGT